MGSAAPIGIAIRHLQVMKKAITSGDLVGRVTQSSRTKPPVLPVVNTGAPMLSEEITCEQRGGVWWLVYSWGEPMCRADDIDAAASMLRRVMSGAR